MYTIIKHIPNTMTIEQLEGLAANVLAGGLFRRKGELKAIKILQLVDKNKKPIEYHALLRVSPEFARERLIKTINSDSGKSSLQRLDPSFDVSKLSAADYVVRYYGNDKRAADTTAVEQQRQNERRRIYLRIRTLSEKLY